MSEDKEGSIDEPCCPDCGVSPGEWHRPGCDVEQCPFCGGQLIRCEPDTPLDDRIKWDGQWPGEKKCLEWGWFAKFTSRGWKRCGRNDPQRQPDLDRLRVDASWHREEKCFVRKLKK